jgi:hypothetical protein
MFVEWFLLLFVASFILSTLIFEVRERGHLRFGIEPSKGMLVGLLLILGFNLILWLPASLILLFLNHLGSSSLLEAAMWALMTLYYLIPAVISGVIVYGTVRGLYNSWGVGLPGFLASVIFLAFSALSVSGWLIPALPWIVEAAVTFVGFGMGWIFIMVIFGLCLSRVVPGARREKEEPEKKRTTTKPVSSESALKLLVGLGRRVVIDASQEALAIMKGIVARAGNAQGMMLSASRQTDIDLQDALSSNDIRYVQQKLDVLTGRFGKVSRRMKYVMIVSAIVGAVSVGVTAVSIVFRIREGIFLLFPGVMVPVLAGFAYQETSSYRPGRYWAPSTNLYNSYLLTDSQFRRKSRSDSLRVVVSLGLLLGVAAFGLFGSTPSPLMALVAGPMAIIVLILASRDRSIALERLATDVAIRRGLEYLGIDPDEDLGQVESVEQPVEEAWTRPFAESATSPAHAEAGEWKQELQMRGHSDFAEKVERGAREIYDEHAATLYFMATGGILVMVGSMMWLIFSSLPGMFFIDPLPIAFVVIGAPIFIYGAAKYLRARSSARFAGLTRKQLTTTISLLDQEAMGVDSFGSVYDRQAPSEYQAFGMSTLFRASLLRHAMVKLQDRLPWRQEDIDVVWKTRSSYPKLESIALVITSAVTLFLYVFLVPDESLFFPYAFKMLFVGLSFFMVLTSVWSIIAYYREKGALRAFIERRSPREAATSRETLEALLSLLRTESQKPLRVLLVGNYSQVTFTGRSYFTTEGVEAREAVLIPL